MAIGALLISNGRYGCGYPFRKRLGASFQQVDILFELGIDSFVLQVGSDQQVMVSEFSGSGFRFGCDDGVDTADLVANFPTHFEKHVGCHFGITHIFWDFVFPICKNTGIAPAKVVFYISIKQPERMVLKNI